MKYAMKWKKVAQSSNTTIRDISQVFSAKIYMWLDAINSKQ